MSGSKKDKSKTKAAPRKVSGNNPNIVPAYNPAHARKSSKVSTRSGIVGGAAMSGVAQAGLVAPAIAPVGMAAFGAGVAKAAVDGYMKAGESLKFEEQEKAALYDNSKTDQIIGYKKYEFAEACRKRAAKSLTALNGGKMPTMEEIQESAKLTDALAAAISDSEIGLGSFGKWMRYNPIFSDITSAFVEDKTKEYIGAKFGLAGGVEAEYFLLADDNPERRKAEKHGFNPEFQRAAKKGVIIENVAEKGGLILIKNMHEPPESLNCTVRVPRIDDNGNKLPMKDHKGNYIPGNFDTVVIKEGKPALVMQGSRGNCRIANMKDMMDDLQKSSGMKGRSEGRESKSGMKGRSEGRESKSGMKGMTSRSQGERDSLSGMKGMSKRAAAMVGEAAERSGEAAGHLTPPAAGGKSRSSKRER